MVSWWHQSTTEGPFYASHTSHSSPHLNSTARGTTSEACDFWARQAVPTVAFQMWISIISTFSKWAMKLAVVGKQLTVLCIVLRFRFSSKKNGLLESGQLYVYAGKVGHWVRGGGRTGRGEKEGERKGHRGVWPVWSGPALRTGQWGNVPFWGRKLSHKAIVTT